MMFGVFGEKGGASALASCSNERFHVIEVALERPASSRRDGVIGTRHATLERLGAADVIGFLELSRVHAQIAVGGLHQLFEIVEAERLVHRQGAQDAEAK